MSAIEHGPTTGPSDLRAADVAAALRRRWRVVTVFVLAGIGLGTYTASMIAPSASAEVTLLLEATTVDPVEPASTSTGQIDVALEARRLRSTSVLDAVAATLDLDTEELRDVLSVRTVPDTRLLVVGVDGTSAETATEQLTAVVDTYLAERRGRAEESLTARRATLQGQVDDLAGQLAVLEDQIVAAAQDEDTATQSILESRRDTLLERLDDRTADLSRIELLSTDPGSVIDGPLTDDAAAPGPTVIGLGVFALFVLIGLSAALVRDRTDDRIWDAADIERYLPDTPVLLIDAEEVSPDRLADGAVFREVRDLVISFPVPGSITLVVTAVETDDTAPLVAAGIGNAMGRAGLSVVVVDPVGAHTMGVAAMQLGAPEGPGRGLGAFVDGTATLAEATVEATSQPGLRFLRATGARSTDDVTVAPRLRQLLWSRGREPDDEIAHGVSVVVSAPSVLDAPDGAALAGMGDAVILIVRRRRTTRAHLRQALRSLRTHAAPVAVVLALPES